MVAGKRRKRSSSGIIFLLCLALMSCAKPQESYQFVALDPDGIKDAKFSFALDSAVTYTTYFSCRYDLGAVDSDNVKLLIKAESPAGYTYRDTVVFPLYKTAEQAKGDSYTRFNIEHDWYANIEWTWRVNVRGGEYGLWTIYARPENFQGLHSLGFSYRTTNNTSL